MKRQCINEDCNWIGDESECMTYKNSDWARLCPECHENTEETEGGGLWCDCGDEAVVFMDDNGDPFPNPLCFDCYFEKSTTA